MKKILAIDTSTDSASIALGLLSADTTSIEVVTSQVNPGNVKASEFLIANILTLLTSLDWQPQQLDYIVFGCGPGSFTGLRTACAVTQGLAFAANAKVIPINTLAALAQQARLELAKQSTPLTDSSQIVACLDARMNEIYCANFKLQPDKDYFNHQIRLTAPENFAPAPDALLVGNIFTVYSQNLSTQVLAQAQLVATPLATAMLQLLPYYLAKFKPLAPEQALPLYIRNKVALTTAEREQLKAQPAP